MLFGIYLFGLTFYTARVIIRIYPTHITELDTIDHRSSYKPPINPRHLLPAAVFNKVCAYMYNKQESKLQLLLFGGVFIYLSIYAIGMWILTALYYLSNPHFGIAVLKAFGTCFGIELMVCACMFMFLCMNEANNARKWHEYEQLIAEESKKSNPLGEGEDSLAVLIRTLDEGERLPTREEEVAEEKQVAKINDDDDKKRKVEVIKAAIASGKISKEKLIDEAILMKIQALDKKKEGTSKED
jgi:Na+-transporting methylmalonyl-CoA/oxaloacetate decarboxylase gamma subunit